MSLPSLRGGGGGKLHTKLWSLLPSSDVIILCIRFSSQEVYFPPTPTRVYSSFHPIQGVKKWCAFTFPQLRKKGAIFKYFKDSRTLQLNLESEKKG